jgi:glycosyltransferase involved in cell wall biosynthesis
VLCPRGGAGVKSPDAERYKEALSTAGVNVASPGRRGLQTVLGRYVFDLLFCEFWNTAQWGVASVRTIQPWVHLVVDSVDVHFLREEAALKLGIGDPSVVARNKEQEIQVYRTADNVIVVTDQDRLALEAVGGIKGVCLVPLVVTTVRRSDRVRENELVFVGGFNHQPNVDGLLWFVSTIFPLIKCQVPNSKLTVIGSNSPDAVNELGKIPGIEVLGYVPETLPFLDRAAVAIAPLRFGAGMKGKVTEALAAGMPLVSTSVGIQGLLVQSNRELLIADCPRSFADAVVRLLNDKVAAQRMADRGQRYISEVCSADVVRPLLRELLGGVRVKRGIFAYANWAFFAASNPIRLFMDRVLTYARRHWRGDAADSGDPTQTKGR